MCQGGSVRFSQYSQIFVELSCTFSARSPRPSQIKIVLQSKKNSSRSTDHATTSTAHHSTDSDSTTSIDEPSKDGDDQSKRKKKGKQKRWDSLYSAILQITERQPTTTHPSGQKGTEVTSGTDLSNLTVATVDKNTPNHQRKALNSMGRFRFGEVAEAKSSRVSNRSAALGHLSYSSGGQVSRGNHTGVSGANRSGGLTDKSATNTLNGATRNPLGEQVRALPCPALPCSALFLVAVFDVVLRVVAVSISADFCLWCVS